MGLGGWIRLWPERSVGFGDQLEPMLDRALSAGWGYRAAEILHLPWDVIHSLVLAGSEQEPSFPVHTP